MPPAPRVTAKTPGENIAFDFASLEVAIRKAARRAFAEIAAAHPKEQLCAFALYSDDDAITVCPSTNTASHLAKTQSDAARRLEQGFPDDAMVYKFCPPEWRFERVGAGAEFEAICDRVRGHVMTRDGRDALTQRQFATFRSALFETCLRVLESLRRDRAFKDVLLVFAVSDTDFTSRTELARIKRLNPKPVVDEFRAWHKRYA